MSAVDSHHATYCDLAYAAKAITAMNKRFMALDSLYFIFYFISEFAIECINIKSQISKISKLLLVSWYQQIS